MVPCFSCSPLSPGTLASATHPIHRLTSLSITGWLFIFMGSLGRSTFPISLSGLKSFGESGIYWHPLHSGWCWWTSKGSLWWTRQLSSKTLSSTEEAVGPLQGINMESMVWENRESNGEHKQNGGVRLGSSMVSQQGTHEQERQMRKGLTSWGGTGSRKGSGGTQAKKRNQGSLSGGTKTCKAEEAMKEVAGPLRITWTGQDYKPGNGTTAFSD